MKITHNTAEEQRVDHIAFGASILRSLKSFWSRDSVADRVDAAVAALAAQLETSLGKGLTDVRDDVRRVSERCDAIRETTSGVRVIEEAIPKLLSVTDHLVDIGMANVHQTAVVQRTLKSGVGAVVDPFVAGHDDVVSEADSAIETGVDQSAYLAPAERQIFDNFTRAVHAFLS